MGERNKEYFTETFLMLEKLNGGMSSRWYGHIKVWRGGNKVLKRYFGGILVICKIVNRHWILLSSFWVFCIIYLFYLLYCHLLPLPRGWHVSCQEKSYSNREAKLKKEKKNRKFHIYAL